MKFKEPLHFWFFFLLLFASQPYYFYPKIVFKINIANGSSTFSILDVVFSCYNFIQLILEHS
jgi:hypothetical protein